MDKHFIVKSHTSRLYMQMYCWLPLFLGSCQSRWWLVVVLVGAMRWITIPAARYLLSPVGRRRIIFMLIWSIDVHVAWGAPLPLLYALHCSTLKCAKISAIWGWGKPHMRCLLSYLSLLSRIVFFSHALPSLFTYTYYIHWHWLSLKLHTYHSESRM